MPNPSPPVALVANDALKRVKPSNYPPPFASQMQGREKRPLGDLFGLTNFGVNLTQLAPGAVSSLRHAHTTQDEFVYVLQGHPTLHTDEGWTRLSPGMCAGFKAGTGNGHRLVNETSEAVVYSTDMAPTIVRDGQFRLFFFSRERHAFMSMSHMWTVKQSSGLHHRWRLPTILVFLLPNFDKRKKL